MSEVAGGQKRMGITGLSAKKRFEWAKKRRAELNNMTPLEVKNIYHDLQVQITKLERIEQILDWEAKLGK